MAQADIGAQADKQLAQYEKLLEKLKAAQGSAVKTQNAELNLLSLIKDVRDTLGKALDPSDKTREGLLTVFGGDCSRIARFRQLIASTTLSDKNSSDSRFTQSLSSLETIETIIREKGQGEALKAAQDAAQKSAAPAAAPAAAAEASEDPAAAKQKAEEEEAAARLEVERKETEWQKQQDEEAKERKRKAAVAAKKAEEEAAAESSKSVVTKEGQDFAKAAPEPKRDIMVELGCECVPVFDWGDGDEFTLAVPVLKAKIKTIITPPLPVSDLKSYPEEQIVEIEVPEIKNVIFDPITKTPAEGLLKAKVTTKIVLLEIPGNIEAKVGSRAMQPWGAKKLKEGEEITELHYEVQIEESFALVPGKGSSELSVTLDLTFDCKLTGAGSAKFTSDGAERPTPTKK